MEVIKVYKDNLISVIMGKHLNASWRGNSNLTIDVPYEAWFDFILENKTLMLNRSPLDYSSCLASGDKLKLKKFFLYEISWSLYSEIGYCQRYNYDATLILPNIGSGGIITCNDAIEVAKGLSQEDTFRYISNLVYSTTMYNEKNDVALSNYGVVDCDTLSEWNKNLFYISLYLQHMCKHTDGSPINIIWR